MIQDTTNDPRMDPALGADETAVVLIDLQNDIIRNTSNPFHASIAEQVEQTDLVGRTKALVDHARSVGAPVFWVTVVRRRDYADVVNQITQLTADGKAPPPKQQVALIEGTPGARLVDELVPADGDYVVIKKRRGAFLGTDLEFHLRSRGIRNLVVSGVATDLGVENTVRDAWDRDYNVVVVEDLCVAAPPTAHEHAIRSVFPRMARIMSAERVMRELGR